MPVQYRFWGRKGVSANPGPYVEDICLGVTSIFPCDAFCRNNTSIAYGDAGRLSRDSRESLGEMCTVTHCGSADGVGQDLCE